MQIVHTGLSALTIQPPNWLLNFTQIEFVLIYNLKVNSMKKTNIVYG